MRRRLSLPLILTAAAAFAVTALLPSAAAAPAGSPVIDYQDPVQALPPVSRLPVHNCTVTAMTHVFENSYGKPFAGTLTPPAECAGPWSKVVLDWTARSAGRQYDRLAGIWIGGAEVARTSTPEPDPSGITWHFDKDITAFAPLLHAPQPFVVDLGNTVNDTLTGRYDVTVTITYFIADTAHPAPRLPDVVVPLAADPKLPGWQQLADGKPYTARVSVPRNTEQLTAEVYARGGGCEEFWWSNVPTEIAQAHPDAGLCGGGTYREVLLKVDGVPAGVVHPYPVIYTGGVAPMLWRPMSAVDAIVTLPYTVDLTPFAGRLTDGAPHTVELIPPKGIADAWTLGGNLYATTDPGTKQVTGELRDVTVGEPVVRTEVSGTGLDLTINTSTRREWHTAGVLHTSHGVVPAYAAGQWGFDNVTSLAEKASKQRTRQHAAGAYQSGMRRDGFDFTLGADSVAKIVDNNNYRIDATVHMGRILRTDIGRTVAYAEESMDTTGGFGRKDGQVDYADGTATQRWRGLDDTGACFDRTLGAEHGWVNRETTLTRPCGGMWPG